MVSSGGTQAFCLKLTTHQTHMSTAFQKLYNDEVLVDCTLSCTGGTLKAHKLVLAACSPYFAQLFASFSNPYQYPVLILKDMPFEDVKYIVEYMYRGEVIVPQTHLQSVLESAKSLSITGLADIKIAGLESTNAKQATENNVAKTSPSGRKRQKRKVTEGSGADSDGDHADVPMNETEFDANQQSNDNFGQSGNDMADYEEAEVVPDQDDADGSQSHNLRSAQKQTPSALMKANLREKRIEKLQALSGSISAGRKMWSDEETQSLVRVWEEESARVWASAGKKVMSLMRISELLQEQDIDRDVSQVEGKIKALKRDYKAVKSEKAIPAVQTRMVPYLEKLDIIFSRDDS
jgi:hypothetical protein